MTTKDPRDNTRIKTLPDDLRGMAEDMMQKKFGLAKKGEVVEKQKKKEYSPGWRDEYQWTTISTSASKSLSMADLENAQRALNQTQREPTYNGFTARQWVERLMSSSSFRNSAYSVNAHAYILIFKGVHSSARYTWMLGQEEMNRGINTLELIESKQKRIEYEMGDRVMIEDPTGRGYSSY